MPLSDSRPTESPQPAVAATAARALAQGLHSAEDLSPVAWVQVEVRKSLEAAHKSLRRYLRDTDTVRGGDLDTVEPTTLRGARSQLHQSVGALELINLPAAAQVLRAAENLVQRMITRPAAATVTAVESIERLSFALLDYLNRYLAGKLVSPVAMYPQYEAVLQLAGTDRVHPADLWQVGAEDWLAGVNRLEVGSLGSDVQGRAADDASRSEMEALVLGLMRKPGRATCLRMGQLCKELAVGSRQKANDEALAGLWQCASAVYEALAYGLLANDVHTKRVASRLLAQLRVSAGGQLGWSERLAQDLLYLCAHAHAPTAERPAPQLLAVRKAWQLNALNAVERSRVRLGLHDPSVIASAKRRVAAAKDTWAAVAADEQHRLSHLTEQFELVGESLERLLPSGDSLAKALRRAAEQTAVNQKAPLPALSMEVATAFLFVDAALEDGEFDQADMRNRVRMLAQRVERVRLGEAAKPLESWMEELYRSVSERQTMGSVVQELRSSLSEIEKQIDQFFRQPSERAPIVSVPAQLSAMRGVLSVLGLDHASQAVLQMRDDVEGLLQTEVDPQLAQGAGTFDRLAENLGALSFLIDMLSVQPHLAKTLFTYHKESGSFTAAMESRERPSVYGDLWAPVAAPPQAAADLAQTSTETPLAPMVAPFGANTVWPAPPPVAVAAAPASRHGDVKLQVRLQALAAEAAQPHLGDQELLASMELVTQQAVAADRTDLARLLALAQHGLRDSPGSAGSRAVREELVRALTAATSPAPMPLPEERPVPPPRPTPVGGTGLEDDAEMRAIFLEEAHEVIAQAELSLHSVPEEGNETVAQMTTLRRAFHTLKGSSRMVGLRDFGEAAWACEQLYNVRLAEAAALDPDLLQFTLEAFSYLKAWTDAIEANMDGGHRSPAVVRAADALRLQGQLQRIAPALAPEGSAQPQSTPAVGAVVSAAPDGLAARVRDLPSASDLELPLRLSKPEMGSGPAASGPAARAIPAVGIPVLPEGLGSIGSGPADSSRASSEAFGTTAAPPARDKASLASLGFEFELDQQAAAGAASASTPDGPVAPPAMEVLELNLDEFAALLPSATAPSTVTDVTVATPPSPWPTLELPSSSAAPNMDAPAPHLSLVPPQGRDDEESFKRIGPLRISIPLFNVFLQEADELSRRLVTELAEWSADSADHPVPSQCAVLAHGLAGSAGTVGCAGLSALARDLEHALMRSHAGGAARPGERELFNDTAEEIRRLLHQFAAGFLREVPPVLHERLAEHERLPAPIRSSVSGQLEDEATVVALTSSASETSLSAGPDVGAQDASDDQLDVGLVDSVDAELLPIFEEEAQELLPELQARLRDWMHQPTAAANPAACMRTLHTFKGGARLAGAMRLGEMAHRLETAIEHLAAHEGLRAAEIAPLLGRADAMVAVLEALRQRHAVAENSAAAAYRAIPTQTAAVAAPSASARGVETAAVQVPATPVESQVNVQQPDVPAPALTPAVTQVAGPPAVPTTEPASVPEVTTQVALRPQSAGAAPLLPVNPLLDFSRFQKGPVALPVADDRASVGPAGVRVRAALLDRLLNQAGEVTITRTRIGADVRQLQAGLVELGESLDRMRVQLRDIEVQAETQISSRMEAAKAASESFDPLEMDRYTRLQELTRFMAESVNDVASLQRTLQRSLQSAEDQLAAQSRLTRDLQDDLLRTRMVEFESAADRLHRTVRQAAKEAGKQVRLDIIGGAIELDRGVLERMAGPFEHLLRNAVAHGVELEAQRLRAGKPAVGVITIAVAQSGNEVAVDIADDGSGLDLPRIRQRALERKLIAEGAHPTDAELSQLIFRPGFSTASTVTELAGRGVGLDVVRAEVTAMGGRIETQTVAGQGTRFKLLLPLTTAVTQVVMLRCGDWVVAVPSTLIEAVRRVTAAEVASAYADHQLEVEGEQLPFFWLAELLQVGLPPVAGDSRTHTVAVVRSAAQRVVVHVDEVIGNQEVVVKNVGPQLARIPGLAGVTLLASGAVALIYNPVALAAVYGQGLRQQALLRASSHGDAQAAAAQAPRVVPLVMVVDDSLTVRRATERLLVREGYRVVTAKDGMEALELLRSVRPVVLLSDIEMPRMDGFDLLRHVRADTQFRDLPVAMITSRIAHKHREHAAELGADHYLGKPYSEEELLRLVARYAAGGLRANMAV